MVDYFSLAEIITSLHTTVLHEASHLPGTYDFHINDNVLLADSLDNFDAAASGIDNQHIVLDADFIKRHQDSTHLNINGEQLKELIKSARLLKVNSLIL